MVASTSEQSDEDGRKKSPRKKAEKPIQLSFLDHATFEFRMVSKALLTIPVDEYQRDEAAGLIAKDIALNFNKVAFGALTVIERTNGRGNILMVADGGTRLSAALMRPDVDEVACLVFSGLTKEQEADVFLAINQNRRKLGVEQLQHSEVYAGRELALHVESILHHFKTNRVDFNSLAALRSCVKRFPGPTDLVVNLLVQVAIDKHVGVRVFKGMVYLEQHLNKHSRTLKDRSRIAKLKQKFGLLDMSVNAALGSQNIRSNDPLICARAIARAIGIIFPQNR